LRELDRKYARQVRGDGSGRAELGSIAMLHSYFVSGFGFLLCVSKERKGT